MSAPVNLMGLLMIVFIEAPVLLMILTSIFGRPRNFRTTSLLIGSIGLLFITVILGTFLLCGMLRLFVPQGMR